MPATGVARYSDAREMKRAVRGRNTDCAMTPKKMEKNEGREAFHKLSLSQLTILTGR